MALCHIAMGGNVGDVRQTFSRALELLSQLPQSSVRQVSRTYRTAAVGNRAGEPFFNAAAALETEMEPLALLDRFQEVERLLGRSRGFRRGPRPIDLDLILCGDRVVDAPRLQVPHPAAWYRRFVLDPLAEIAGEAVHPVKGLAIRELRARLLARPLHIALAGGESGFRDGLVAQLRSEFPSARFRPWNIGSRGDVGEVAEPAIVFWLGEAGAQEGGARRFEELPAVPRLDATKLGADHGGAAHDDLTTLVRDVLKSALDEPVVCG